MTAVTTLADARALLDELSPKPQLPAIIFAQMCKQIDISPPELDLSFNDKPWADLLPPPSLPEAVQMITGHEFAAWQYSDAAALLRFLNDQSTAAHKTIDIVDGYVTIGKQGEDDDVPGESTESVGGRAEGAEDAQTPAV